MYRADTSAEERTYVDGLRWRRGDLQARLGQIRAEIEGLNQAENEFTRELHAVDLLLMAVGDPASDASEGGIGSSGLRFEGQSPARREGDLSGVGPTARRIYECAEQVLREAGVPIHYRVLADEIQKRVALSGADPGATLLAHLHRAPQLFPRVGRGVYSIPELAPAQNGAGLAALSSSGRRRPRVQRRKK